jgi:hypothetical protein
MKIALTAAILGSALAPAFSLSYLESLNRANPVMASPMGASNGASYLSSISAPVGSAPSGTGVTSYLDALPKNPSTMGGSGMNTYTDNLGGGSSFAKPAAPAAPAAAAKPAFTPTPTTVIAAVAGKTYMEALGSATSAGAPTGAGLLGYLDALPRTSAVSGGSGIRTYTDNLPVSDAVIGTGAGLNTYTDNLSGGKAVSGKSFSPFGASKGASFSGSTGGAEIGFTLEAENLADLISQLQGNGGTIKLSGSVESIVIN